MFRRFASICLTLLAIGCAAWAQDTAIAEPGAEAAAGSALPPEALSWLELLASGDDPAADCERYAKALADRYQEAPEGLWLLVDAAQGTVDEPDRPWAALGVVAMKDASPRLLSVFLAFMEAAAQDAPQKPLAFLLAAPGAVPGPDLPVDPGASSLVFLDGAHDYRLSAAGGRSLCPLSFVDRAREALSGAGLSWQEDWADGLLVKLGLSSGTADLAPWLAAGYQALALGAALARPEQLRALADRGPEDTAGDDVNYLRYPLPGRVLTLADKDAMALSALLMAVALLYAAVHRRRREAFREALTALFLVLLALGLALLVARVSAAAFKAALGFEAASSWPVLAARFLAAAFMYYALSGFASRLGLLKDAARVSGMHAAALIIGLAGCLASALAPAMAPVLMALAALSLTGAASGPIAAVALILSLAATGPFLVALASPDHVMASAKLLAPGWLSILSMALVLAPVSLWLGSALSSGRQLARAHKPAPLMAALGLLVGALEPLLAQLLARA